MPNKKLYRSEDNKVFGGILGGIGEYLDVDPAILRLIYLAVTIFTGFVPGLLLYLLAFLAVPKKPLKNIKPS